MRFRETATVCRALHPEQRLRRGEHRVMHQETALATVCEPVRCVPRADPPGQCDPLRDFQYKCPGGLICVGELCLPAADGEPAVAGRPTPASLST